MTPDQLGASNVTVNGQALAAGPSGTDLGSVLGDLAAGNDAPPEIVANRSIDGDGDADTNDGDPDTAAADDERSENAPTDLGLANDQDADDGTETTDGGVDGVPVSGDEEDGSSTLEGGASDVNLEDEEEGELSEGRGDDGARHQRPDIGRPDGGEPAVGGGGVEALSSVLGVAPLRGGPEED